MYLFDVASAPIDLMGSIDRFEERLGQFFAARDFPMRLIAHSTAFPMHEPVAAVRDSIHRIESLYARTLGLREAIDAWCLDHASVDLQEQLNALDERERHELAEVLCIAGFDLTTCRRARSRWNSGRHLSPP